jgi:hypothetical protein
MKKIIEDFVRQFGCETSYSGHLRIMYIKGERAHDARRKARELYPNLAFELQVQESLKGSLQVFAGGGIDEQLAASVVDKAMETVFGPEIAVQDDQSTQGENEQRPATREEVDEYLINNPVDRAAKNPYNNAAAILRVKPDYVRGRWRSLRERGLVEKELQTENE